jgi:hypothetical protein
MLLVACKTPSVVVLTLPAPNESIHGKFRKNSRNVQGTFLGGPGSCPLPSILDPGDDEV